MRSETASPMVSSGVRSANSWLIWNVRAMPSGDALVRLEIGDVAAFEHDAPGGRAQHAGQQVDDRGLAGAVRADQRVARAFLDGERHVVGRDDAAELLHQPLRFKHGGHLSSPPVCAEARLEACFCTATARSVIVDVTAECAAVRARAPPARTSVNTMLCMNGSFGPRADREDQRRHDGAVDAPEHDHHHQHEPEPELPVLRVHIGEIVLHQLEQHRADQPAVEIAGAADDQRSASRRRSARSRAPRARRTACVCVSSAPAMPA